MEEANLTEVELRNLIVKIVQAAGDAGITREEVARHVEWFERALADGTLARLVLSGRISIVRVENNELVFDRPQ